MTKQQTERLAMIDEQLHEKVSKYNDALKTGKTPVKLDEEIKQLVNERAGIIKKVFYNDCIATGDAMLAAVQTLQYTSYATTDTTKKSEIDDEKVTTRSIIQKTYNVDLLNFNRAVQGGIGHDPKWVNMVEKLNLVLTLDYAKRTNDKRTPEQIRDSYVMQEISKDIELGKNPCSKTQLLKTLNMIVQAMLGDGYKCTSHDVEYITSNYTKIGKNPGESRMASHKTMVWLVACVCWHIVTGKSYKALFKEKKVD